MCRSAGADTLVARYGLMVGSPSGAVAWGRRLGRVRHAQERPGPGRCGAVRGTYDQRRLRRVLVLMISIAQRTVPFDAMAEPPPSTSEQLAWITSLNECYVREWLAAMEVGRIVEHDPND